MAISKQNDNYQDPVTSFRDKIKKDDFFKEKIFKKDLDRDIACFLYRTKNSGRTRDQICEAINAARSSVYDSLARMILMDIIEIDHKILNKTKKGRPSTIYYLKHPAQKRL
jgi:predicted transcriptional regulator